MSNTKPKIQKNFQDVALDNVASKFAKLMGINNIPVIWTSNPYKVPTKGGEIRSYPMGFMYVQDISVPQHVGHKKHSNVFQYIYADKGRAMAFTLTPISLNVQFELISDDYQQAFQWATDLLIMRQEHASNSKLSFSTTIKEINFSVPTQVIMITDNYPIDRVEYTEDQPMEYRIVGQLQVLTRATKGGMMARVIPTFNVSDETDPEHAVLNEDGSASRLFSTADGTKTFPIRLRSNMGD